MRYARWPVSRAVGQQPQQHAHAHAHAHAHVRPCCLGERSPKQHGRTLLLTAYLLTYDLQYARTHLGPADSAEGRDAVCALEPIGTLAESKVRRNMSALVQESNVRRNMSAFVQKSKVRRNMSALVQKRGEEGRGGERRGEAPGPRAALPRVSSAVSYMSHLRVVEQLPRRRRA